LRQSRRRSRLAASWVGLVIVAAVAATAGVGADLPAEPMATRAVLAPATAPAATATSRLAPGLSEQTLALALRAHARGLARGEVTGSILSIIDYALPSTAKRLWVLDLARNRVLFHELVAHGRGTGDNEARAFSNNVGSHQSSLGVFRTGDAYVGEHGVSLRLEGLEPGFNDRAEKRAIVIHGAPYVSSEFAARHGRIGRSYGCPAVRAAIADSLIATIHGGSMLFASYPDPDYASQSKYVTPSVLWLDDRCSHLR